jgi:hypothetical protein
MVAKTMWLSAVAGLSLLAGCAGDPPAQAVSQARPARLVVDRFGDVAGCDSTGYWFTKTFSKVLSMSHQAIVAGVSDSGMTGSGSGPGDGGSHHGGHHHGMGGEGGPGGMGGPGGEGGRHGDKDQTPPLRALIAGGLEFATEGNATSLNRTDSSGGKAVARSLTVHLKAVEQANGRVAWTGDQHLDSLAATTGSCPTHDDIDKLAWRSVRPLLDALAGLTPSAP